MCHEYWWRERRRRDEESREVWLDFERTEPADAPAPPEEEPDTIRLGAEDDTVAVER